MTGIVITGASGRMGQMLIKVVEESDHAHLVGVTEREGHPWVGQDLGIAMGQSEMDVPVVSDAIEVVKDAQAIIDFTSPASSVAMAQLVGNTGAVHVIGTTGLSDDDLAQTPD